MVRSWFGRSSLSLWLKILVGAALLLAATAAAGWLWVSDWRADPQSIRATGTFELSPGEPFGAFATKLHRAGVVEHPRLWSWLARLDGSATQVKAGEYAVQAGDTPDSLLARLVARDVVTYHLQIIEGWTVTQALAALAADPVLQHELTNVQPADLMQALGLAAGPPEGRFFPDTYRFERGDSDAELMRRAHRRMDEVLAAAWATRAAGLPYHTPDEALIVASLVEKETGNESDRERIARVFVNRLEAGMRLQTDPTVIYGLGTRFEGNLTREHLAEDTPYNTYVHAGLPPSPIALPGARSIAAALHPAPGDYLYFVSRGDGTSQFSITLEEHNRAVQRYQIP
jgi:UPF0755 protein